MSHRGDSLRILTPEFVDRQANEEDDREADRDAGIQHRAEENENRRKGIDGCVRLVVHRSLLLMSSDTPVRLTVDCTEFHIARIMHYVKRNSVYVVPHERRTPNFHYNYNYNYN